jgi:hypothetical protein
MIMAGGILRFCARSFGDLVGPVLLRGEGRTRRTTWVVVYGGSGVLRRGKGTDTARSGEWISFVDC